MDTQTVKQIMKEELPKLVRSDKRIRKFVLDMYIFQKKGKKG